MWSFLREISSGNKLYTLNFDGSHNNQANKSGAGVIIRDNQGEFKLAASYNLTETYSNNCNVALVEAKGLLNGLILAKENNLNINIIRGDSTEVIDYVLNRSRRPAKPPLNQIINEIKDMINPESQTIEDISREANQVADKLASLGSNGSFLGGCKIYFTYVDLPPQVASLIQQEKSGNKMKEVESGEGSSMISNIGKVVGGLAIGGLAIAYGLSKLSEETSFNDPYRNEANATWNSDTHNYTYKSSYSYDFEENTRNRAPKNNQINEFYMLNFDGSDINQHQEGGAGCIIRNKERDLIVATAYNLDYLYPNKLNVAIAEAIGLRNGLNLAKNLNLRLGLIEGDSKEVIDRVLGIEKKPPRNPYLSEIINEIKVALNDQSIDRETQIKVIPRYDNEVANELASIGSRLECGMVESYDKDDVLTSKLAQLIKKDKLAKGITK